MYGIASANLSWGSQFALHLIASPCATSPAILPTRPPLPCMHQRLNPPGLGCRRSPTTGVAQRWPAAWVGRWTTSPRGADGVENCRAAIDEFCTQMAVPRGVVPSVYSMQQAKRYDLHRAVRTWGGLSNLAQALGPRWVPWPYKSTAEQGNLDPSCDVWLGDVYLGSIGDGVVGIHRSSCFGARGKHAAHGRALHKLCAAWT